MAHRPLQRPLEVDGPRVRAFSGRSRTSRHIRNSHALLRCRCAHLRTFLGMAAEKPQSAAVPRARIHGRKTDRAASIDAYLQRLWDASGTDLLLTAGAPPLLRIDGKLKPYDGADPLTPADLDKIVSNVLGEDLQAKFDFEGEVDFSFSWKNQARFRGNAFRQRQSTALALRLIPFYIPSFDELGLPDIITKFVNLPLGLVLVTGPTGSGKSTTLASMI